MMEDKQDNNEFTPARKQALTKAFEMHGAAVERYFYRRIGNIEIAEDLSQILWGQVYKTFTVKQFFELKLLFHKALQVVSNFIKHSGVRDFIEYTNNVPNLAQSVARADYKDEKELEKRFWETEYPHVKLSDSDKLLFWLRAHHDIPFEDLAERFSSPKTTIQSRYYKICEILAEAYSK